jgi:hypothetical protein
MVNEGGSPSEEAPTVTAFADTVVRAMADAPAGHSSAADAPAGADRYEVQREIGEGGMGRVLEAIDRQFGRRVAIKELLQTDSNSLRARFQVEAVVTANLEHPGVAPVYDRGVDAKGQPYYAMRLIRGRTLADAISEANDLPARLQLIPVVVRVAQTLAYAHDHGIIHRDVKPANIVVGRHGETVLLDWGIAKVRGVGVSEALRDDGDSERLATAPATRHGAVIGTPAYMAPEQAAGEVAAIDERTDVFALGALLYHVLSGRAPFEGPTIESQIESALSADHPALEELQPNAPVRLSAICARAMAKEPSERFDTAKEVAAALEDALTDALAGRGSKVVDAFANLLSVGMIVVGLAGAVLVWRTIPAIYMLGWGVFPTIVFGVGAILLGLLDLATTGRHKLSTLVLALTGVTVISGVLGTATGLLITLEAALKNEGVVNGWMVAMGSYESLGNLVVAAGMAAAALLIWGVARRRALRAQARPSHG